MHRFEPTKEQLHKLQLQFDDIRTSEGGTMQEHLTKNVFKHNFRKVLKPHYIDRVFDALDLDHDGQVSFREFVLVTHILFDGDPEEKIDYLFKLYDTNGDGKLSKDEVGRLLASTIRSMKAVVKSFGSKDLVHWTPPVDDEQMTKDMTQKFMAEADANQDGVVTLNEFRAYARKHPELIQELIALRNNLHKIVNEYVTDQTKAEQDDGFDDLFDHPTPKKSPLGGITRSP